MILRNLQRFNPIYIIIFFLISILLWIPHFRIDSDNLISINQSNTFIYNSFAVFLNQTDSQILKHVLSYLLVIIQAYLIIQLDYKYVLIEKRSFLVAFIYILLATYFSDIQTLNAVSIACCFLLISVYILFSSYKSQNSLSVLFNAGFVLSIGCLFYINLCFYLIYLYFILFSLRTYNWHEALSLLIGFFTPIFFYISIYIGVTTNIPEVFLMLKNNLFYHNTHRTFTSNELIFIVFIIILILIANFIVLKIYPSKNIIIRKYYNLLFWLFVFSSLIYLFIPSGNIEIFSIMFISVSFLFTFMFSNMKSIFLSELLFFVFIVLFVLTKYTSVLADLF